MKNNRGKCPFKARSLLIEELKQTLLIAANSFTQQFNTGWRAALQMPSLLLLGEFQEKPTSSGKVVFPYSTEISDVSLSAQDSTSSATNYILSAAQHFTTVLDKALGMTGHLGIPCKQTLSRTLGLFAQPLLSRCSWWVAEQQLHGKGQMAPHNPDLYCLFPVLFQEKMHVLCFLYVSVSSLVWISFNLNSLSDIPQLCYS